MEYLPYRQRFTLVEGFNTLVKERIRNRWQPYFLTFMFNNIPGRATTKSQIMTNEVCRVYRTLLSRVVRKPRSLAWNQYCPIFVGCPDLPVAKREKDLVRNLNVNGGLHFNGCLLLPPYDRCRLNEPLDKHFRRHQERYYWDEHPLDRIHVEPTQDGTMIDYAFKHIIRGNVPYDDILILPRARSELSRRDK